MGNNTYTYQNKRIEEENFIFDDKGGKFFMYAYVVKKLCKDGDAEHQLEVWSENDADGKCVSLKVKVLFINAKCFRTANGKTAYLKIDYNRVKPENLYYIIQEFIDIMQVRFVRLLDENPVKDTLYAVKMNNSDYYYPTKEEFEMSEDICGFEPLLQKRIEYNIKRLSEKFSDYKFDFDIHEDETKLNVKYDIKISLNKNENADDILELKGIRWNGAGIHFEIICQFLSGECEMSLSELKKRLRASA